MADAEIMSSLDESVVMIQHEIERQKKENSLLIIAIDGRCASGKTTLAAALSKKIGCEVIHMDDFFLQPYQRTAKRYQEAGGNVDHERFEKEVLIPLRKCGACTFQRYDCSLQRLSEEVSIDAQSVIIVEGSYSLHPCLYSYYDLKIFLDIDKKKQMDRIKKRNGEDRLEIFLSTWIPLEEKYFSVCQIKEKCELCFQL